MKQDERFIEKRDHLRKFLKLNQVFGNIQLRTKVYGQKVNGVPDLALSDREKELAKEDLNTLESAIMEFKKELE